MLYCFFIFGCQYQSNRLPTDSSPKCLSLFGLGFGLGLTVIGHGLGLGLMKYVVSVSYVLVSWSQIDLMFLMCNDFWLCPVFC